METVKGFADQEQQVLTAVVEARAKATQAQVQIPPDILTNPEAMKRFQDAQNQLGGALGQLLAVVERYPDIKSGQNFLALQSQLEGTENRIAIARRDYIEAVRVYNTEITTFPGRHLALGDVSSSQPMATFDIRREESRRRKRRFRHQEVGLDLAQPWRACPWTAMGRPALALARARSPWLALLAMALRCLGSPRRLCREPTFPAAHAGASSTRPSC